jgi:hypothetical protein
MRCLLSIDGAEPGEGGAPLQASVFYGAVAPGSTSLSPSSILYAPGMAGSADVTSYTTVDATFNGLRVLATPLLWDVLSWLSVPAELQVTAIPHEALNTFLSAEVLPMMIWAVNNMQARVDAATATVGGGGDAVDPVFFPSPTGGWGQGAGGAPARILSSPAGPLRASGPGPGPAPPAAVSRTAGPVTPSPSTTPTPAPSPQPVAGNAVRVRVVVNSPAVFFAEDLTDCTSPALGLTANMKAWVDMSPAGDMAVCLDADNIRGMRVECPTRGRSTAGPRATWPAYVGGGGGGGGVGWGWGLGWGVGGGGWGVGGGG